MSDPLTTSATTSDPYSKLFKFPGAPAYEFHSIIVKSLPENRIFDTIKLSKISVDLLYLRPKSVSSFPKDHHLLLRGPKVAIFGSYETSILIGDLDWDWNAGFDDYACPNFGIQSVIVQDPEFPEAVVEIVFEKISQPAQAHFRTTFYDHMNKDRQINIVRGEIAAISNGDLRTKRLLRCFGDDLIEHMLPSESKKIKPYTTKLVSKEAIDLYKSQMILPAKSELIIDFKLELELVTGGSTTRSSVSFERKVSFIAPAEPDWLENKDLIPYAMEISKETCMLEIDEFARIQVEVSWFNDRSSYVHPNVDLTLWGYKNGDCDYKGIGIDWADRQEINESQ